jgi:hypothetical protein
MELINHRCKACFVQGLNNKGIQTINRSNGDLALLSASIDTALEEESAVLSARERWFSVQISFRNIFKGSTRVSVNSPGRRSNEQM